MVSGKIFFFLWSPHLALFFLNIFFNLHNGLALKALYNIQRIIFIEYLVGYAVQNSFQCFSMVFPLKRITKTLLKRVFVICFLNTKKHNLLSCISVYKNQLAINSIFTALQNEFHHYVLLMSFLINSRYALIVFMNGVTIVNIHFTLLGIRTSLEQ